MDVQYHLIGEEDFNHHTGEGYNKTRVEAKRRDLERMREIVRRKKKKSSIRLPTREEVKS